MLAGQTWAIEVFRPQRRAYCELPLFSCPVSAGFPSPAEDYLEGKLDLNKHLIAHLVATFFVRVAGESMVDAGIHPGDLLIVDRALEAIDGKVIIAVVDGELLVKRLHIAKEQVYLKAENSCYPTLEITEAMDFQVWGVVTNVIHSV